jgi:hypothetical protein
MQTFKQQVTETTGMRIIDLLPKKVKRMIYRHQHSDKYKAALLMMRALRKDPDVISRGLSKAKIQSIAADHFGLNHREFAKVLNRKTRYEDAPPGMADTVKKFKADGMDDDMAFALAWKIYNKKKNEAEYITEATTKASTYFEWALIAMINDKSRDEKTFIRNMKRDKGYTAWLKATDKKWNQNQSDHYEFSKKLKQITGANKSNSAGQSSPTTSAMWKDITGKGKDISKADINIGNHKVSVKGTQARLMSGGKEESLATLYAAFDTIDVDNLGQNLEKIVNEFVSRVRTVGDTMTSTALKEKDPKTLSIENKKAFQDLETQVKVKVQAETAFKMAFANKQFANAFAWEAMSGEKKFNNSEGIADAMLVWPYNLRNIAWYPKLNLNHKYVKKVSSQMKFSASVKSSSYKKKNKKYGYSISQVVSLAFKTADSEFDVAKNESIEQRLNLENLLQEGKIDEAKLLDKLKGIWQRLKNAIMTAWTKLMNAITNLGQQIKDAIDGGLDTMLDAFELEPVIKFNNNIKL